LSERAGGARRDQIDNRRLLFTILVISINQSFTFWKVHHTIYTQHLYSHNPRGYNNSCGLPSHLRRDMNYRHFKHALKGHNVLGYSRSRRTVANLLSCTLEALLTFRLRKYYYWLTTVIDTTFLSPVVYIVTFSYHR